MEKMKKYIVNKTGTGTSDDPIRPDLPAGIVRWENFQELDSQMKIRVYYVTDEIHNEILLKGGEEIG